MQTDPCNASSALLSLDDALSKLRAVITPIQEQQSVTITEALGRTLASPLPSPIDLPSECNSAMDGYAFCSADVQQEHAALLTLIGTSWAGKPFTSSVKSGECVRIFTGAVLPAGTDSVVMQEHVQRKETGIVLPVNVKPKQNIRYIGEDIRRGEILLDVGRQLTPVDIGLLAATGMQSVNVIRPLRIAFFSNGDELVSAGQPLGSGQIYDSNRYTLQALLRTAGFQAEDLGTVGDNPEHLQQFLLTQAPKVDVLISSGGASVGDADHIHSVLARCGQVEFWKIAIKPGKPLAFGRIGDTYFFGLPGNPVAVITTFQKIVLPALLKLNGLPPARTWQLHAVCLDTLKKAPGRMEFQRGMLSQNPLGHFEVRSAGAQGSHQLKSFSKANCYIVLTAECSGVNAGEYVTVEPFALSN